MSTLEVGEIPAKTGNAVVYAESYDHPPYPHTRAFKNYYAKEEPRNCGRTYAITHYFHPFENTHAPVASQEDLRKLSLRKNSSDVQDFLASTRGGDAKEKNDEEMRRRFVPSPYARIYCISSQSPPFEHTRMNEPPQWKESTLKREKERAWERSFLRQTAPAPASSRSSVPSTSSPASSPEGAEALVPPAPAPPPRNLQPVSSRGVSPDVAVPLAGSPQHPPLVRPFTGDVTFRGYSGSPRRGNVKEPIYLTTYGKDYVSSWTSFKNVGSRSRLPEHLELTQTKAYSPSYDHGRRMLITSKFPPFEKSHCVPSDYE